MLEIEPAEEKKNDKKSIDNGLLAIIEKSDYINVKDSKIYCVFICFIIGVDQFLILLPFY